MAGNIPIRYVVTSHPANGLASLASDANLLAGWQTAVVDNTVNLCDDYLWSATIKLGTSPTAAKQIEAWVFEDTDFAGTYLGGFGATSAGLTLAFANQKPLLMRNVTTWILDSGVATGSLFLFVNFSIKSLLGYVPGHHGLWFVHNTGAALDSTAGNHVITATGIGWQYT
jgi:hypothetical protein